MEPKEYRICGGNAFLIQGDRKETSVFITIAIPTYKRPQLLEQAIASAIKQVGAEQISYEIIVVDNDARADVSGETYDVVKRHKDAKLLYYINHTNVGMVNNWNQCLKLARGEWVALLHDDDMLDSDYLIRISKYVKNYPLYKCFIPNWRETDIEGNLIDNKKNRRNKKWPMKVNRRGVWAPNDMDRIMMNYNFYGMPSCGVLINRKCAIDIGGFCDSYAILADWEFYFRFQRHYGLLKLKEIMSSYRWGDNLTLLVRKKHLKELIEDTQGIFYSLYPDDSTFHRFIQKLSVKGFSWEICHSGKGNTELVPYKHFSILDCIQIFVLALLRRVYMYFRELFCLRY